MRACAEAWPDPAIVQQAVGQLPWGHNSVLLTRLKDPEWRLTYAQQAIEHGWSRNVLNIHIETQRLEREGKAVTNFNLRLPQPQSDLACESLKDPYRLDFPGLSKEAEERAIEIRTLIHTHQHGRIENNDLRLITGVDTHGASQLLRRLRDRNLLELHAHGANSYYTLPTALQNATNMHLLPTTTDRTSPNIEGSLPNSEVGSPNIEGSSPNIEGSLLNIEGSNTQQRGEQQLPTKIAESIAALGPRPKKLKLRAVIVEICSFYEWSTVAELAHMLDFVPSNLVERHLSPMVKEGQLIRRYPDTPTHQAQAYRSASKQSILQLHAEKTL